MIRLKNMNHHICEFSVGQTLTNLLKDAKIIPFDGYIADIYAVINAPGSGAGPSIFDLHYMDTTIFAASTKITCAATTGVMSYSTLSTVPTQVTAGAIMTLEVDSIATAPRGLAVNVVITKTPVADAVNVADHNNLL